MEYKEKKSFYHFMRSLHRDIGFFVIGLTVVFCISGIVLIFRDTDFLKQEVLIEKQIESNVDSSELGGILRIRGFEVVKTEGETVYFGNGSYNKSTGIVKYSSKELPLFLNKLNSLHKTPSRKVIHWFTLIYGVLLLFLALSSFWMFKARTKLFWRGIYIASAGLIIAAILLVLL